MASISCPSCASTELLDRGAIPTVSQFAGHDIRTQVVDGRLYACASCHLHFRHPHLPAAVLERLYQDADDDIWSQGPAQRTDYDIARSWICGRQTPGDILDLGCYTGDFLESVRTDSPVYGIEVNRQASARAEARGVEIVGATFEDLERFPARFAVITAFDVIEHVADPLHLLSRIKASLAPGGITIISTGNTSARSWRFMGAAYYYCTNNEHISFVNPQWIVGAARNLGMTQEATRCFAHLKASLPYRLAQTLHNCAYRVSPALTHWLYRTCYRRSSIPEAGHALPPPNWASARDHVIFCLGRGP